MTAQLQERSKEFEDTSHFQGITSFRVGETYFRFEQSAYRTYKSYIETDNCFEFQGLVRCNSNTPKALYNAFRRSEFDND
jgi:hypothetical protein